MKKNVVALAVSGGIDSLVAGFLLKQKYNNIFGLHFKTGYESGEIDIRLLEKQLGLDIIEVDLSRQFEKHVIEYFVQTYLNGKTPNPCVICNKTIKFGALLKQAERLGADKLATGHYANIVSRADAQLPFETHLKKGIDPKKDQSYFLSMLSSDQLKKIIFPLGQLTKEQVKEIAAKNKLTPILPGESQDICFIHQKNFADFIAEKLQLDFTKGDIVNISGKVVGQHSGLHRYTIGQRRGLNCPASEPYYVRQIDMKNNRLVVCFKKDLIQSGFSIKKIHWNYHKRDRIDQVMTKIRYTHPGALATISFENNGAKVSFNTPQNAVTPGQVAVFYLKDRVLGAGIIQ